MAKKPFINRDNPALNFISTASTADDTETEKPVQAKPQPAPAEAPTGYKVDPRYIEVKSKRLQLVMQPSLYEKVKTAASVNGISVNEYIHQILKDATKEIK